ncbi:E3 ubiquitin-protein ligase TRIM45-like [Saccostrea cucullata]|uniref:E3 ubiquitin-protein ligase TRIM45-like n=1 Tax=Saccostrea cuccullata TaxID=36930 RepID=UPI002ED41EE0
MQSAVVCDTCENTAEYLCKTCHDKLCTRCKDIHSKSKSSFDHEVTRLIFESLSVLSKFPSVQVCRYHPGFRANICCRKCEVPVCEKCLVGEHNGHKLVATKELFQEKKEKMESKLSFVESELPKYEAKLNAVRLRQSSQIERTEVSKILIHSHLRDFFEIKEILAGNEGIQYLSFQLNDNTFWVYSMGEQVFSNIDRSGNVLHKGEEGVTIRVVDNELTEGKILQYNRRGQIMNEIKNPLLFRWIFKVLNENQRLESTYIAENINGDICISNIVVDTFDKNGEFRFSYNSKGSTFFSRGVCTDSFGNILIADKNSHFIHILNIEGELLKLMGIPGLRKKSHPITFTIDANYCLCVGLFDGRIKILKYIE